VASGNGAGKVAELDPNFVPSWLALGQTYVQTKRFTEGISELERAVSLSRGSPVYITSLAHAYGATGRRADTLRLIEDLKKLDGQRYVASFDLAIAWTGLDERKRARIPSKSLLRIGRHRCFL
jgi:predicted Zn-dependent protease